MHIPDGILPVAVALGGYATSAVVLAFSLRQIRRAGNTAASIPKAALMTAVFAVASWISIPIPPASVHFLLVGAMGVMLGYYAFPAIWIGLLFQAVLFQHGGLTTLGINSICFGIPALLTYRLLGPWLRGKPSLRRTAMVGGMAGMFGTALTVLVFYAVLIAFIPADLNAVIERRAITLLSLAHLPLVVLEGVFVGLLFMYLYRTRPRLLGIAS